jgi:hypothetical protein
MGYRGAGRDAVEHEFKVLLARYDPSPGSSGSVA